MISHLQQEPSSIRIAIASGKGGTGKTTVATNLSYMAAHHGRSVAYVDCDVEEPNGHVFLQPEIDDRQSVGTPVPQLDEAKCVHCGQCAAICQYSAVVCLGEKVLIYPELCHGCGGCERVCPTGAISELIRERGFVETGRSGDIRFVQGSLNVGEAMSPPIIKAAKSAAPPVDLVVLDAPPGTSCPVITTVQGCDAVILVTEPTPFGMHDLKLAVDMIRVLKLPFGVVINRMDADKVGARDFCRQNDISLLAEIPDDRRIAEAYSRGRMICEALPEYASLFMKLLDESLKLSRSTVG